ncbi:MAG: malate dehydrogenase [Candidatus Handelsmanbacteria bacterium RIFCSPLOWO2_12_FULL_64_10]|uniref:Malate dehydrogenase n=1 Tax=Handelsmanbacteria sp. (strain RIFCSPLOWO2_12_FULL_64_10) TaxID=1817868 RepID=A0A1F6CSW7_HANXR|nr:MAG: malate dehydrogenase [Candidatus Handelsmanbacteria bacterium RIFCSPLOWO2_12_FULL_64_10]
MKIAVIGAGNVGATVAQRIAERELAEEVALIDVVEGIPQGKGLDLAQTGPVEGFDTRVTGANDLGAAARSALVIVTAGIARKPGMSRDDLQATNASIVRSICAETARIAPDAIFLLVTNPLDAMCAVALKATGLDPRRVVGMAGILDTARFRTFIAMELKVSVSDVTALVLGGHGDAMVPLSRCSSVGGIPLTELLPQEKIDRIVQRTRDGGAEIVGHLKTGSAYYAPSAAVTEMAEAILRNRRRVLPCSAYLTGQYGLRDLFLGVPVKLGAGGVQDILEIGLQPDERAALHRSADAVRASLARLAP